MFANKDLQEALAKLTRTDLRQGLLPRSAAFRPAAWMYLLILYFGGVLKAAAPLPIELSTSS